MCDFFAQLTDSNDEVSPHTLELISKAVLSAPIAHSTRHYSYPGCHLLVTEYNGRAPLILNSSDKRILVVVKGIMFDPQGPVRPLDEDRFCDEVRQGDFRALSRYEGTFACLAWDTLLRCGWVFNDQASQLHLYHIRQRGSVYVGTNALAISHGLNLHLDPHGVQDFLASGLMFAPRTVFSDLKRLSTGELLTYKNGRLDKSQVWDPLSKKVKSMARGEALTAVKDVLVDRCQRYWIAADNSRSGVCDITGGYDSRLVAAACQRAGIDLSLTVNGPSKITDVRIAHEVATAAGLDLRHFDTSQYDLGTVDLNHRRELLYRSGGELPYTNILHHRITRWKLAKEFGIHFVGGGGEFLRYYAWSQEFFGIGMRKRANLDRALRYRYLGASPPDRLFIDDWYPDYSNRLRDSLDKIFDKYPDSLTTEQLDVAYLWKKTANPSVHLSAFYGWMPTVCPLLSAGVIEIALSINWPVRLTSRFQRQLIEDLNHDMAKVKTSYGGLGRPATLGTVHHEAKQWVNRADKLSRKLDKMIFRGIFHRRQAGGETNLRSTKRVFTDAKSLLDPSKMRSVNLFDPAVLRSMIDSMEDGHISHEGIIERIANIELICRELQFTPEKGFLSN